MIKTLFTILVVIGLLAGCTTNNTPLTPEQKTEAQKRRAQRIAEMAAYDAGIISLKEKKNTAENRQVLSGITNQLAGFGRSSNITPSDVSAYIAQLPIKELKTVEGQMIAGGILLIIDEITGDRITVDTSILQPVIDAAIRGFGRAIQMAEANPYVPPAPKTTNGVAPGVIR